MSLSDAMGGKGKAVAVKVAAEPLKITVEEAAARLLKAVHGNDALGVADALRMAHTACADEYGDTDHDGA